MNRKNFLRAIGLTAAGTFISPGRISSQTPFTFGREQIFNMHGYSAPKLDKVRVGFIGVGSRGSGSVIRFSSIEGVEVKA